MRGDLPFQKCKAALDSVVFEDEESKEEMGSIFADIIAHMGQDVSFLISLSLSHIKFEAKNCCIYNTYENHIQRKSSV